MYDWSKHWQRIFQSDSAEPGFTSPGLAPFDLFGSVLNVVRDRVVGHRRTLRVKGREATFILDDISVSDTEQLRSLGQYGEVVLTGHDLESGTWRVERFELRAHNVHVRPTGSPTLIAAPVLFEAHVAPSQLKPWLAQRARWLDATFLDEGAQLRLAHRAPYIRLDVTPVADGRAIRIVPRTLRIGSRQRRLRLPGYSIALQGLPPDVLVTNVQASSNQVVVSGLCTEWRWSLSRDQIKKFIASLRGGQVTINP
jgi:hypothetical protein